MAGEAAAALLQIQMMQSLFSTFESNVHFGAFLCPMDAPIEKITSIGSFNFIIIGAGTAGSVLAYRLSTCPHVSVLLLETGGCPPFESAFLGYFPILPQTKYDYNMTTVNNHYSLQNLQGGVAGVTVGRMLGGSSSIQHQLHVRGGIPSFEPWAAAANDSSWSYAGLLPYFIKSENILDNDIKKKYPTYHGTCGPVKIKRQPSTLNNGIFRAFSELNYTIKIDSNNNKPAGVDEPGLEIDDKFRQSGLVSYLYPVKDRPNLFVLTGATATKIIFNDRKVATSVQFSYKGSSYIVKSIDEIIVCAGAIKTPQLLLLSGVGPFDHLKIHNIPVVSNLPVGENLQDHVSAPIVITLNRDTSPAIPFNPTEFPVPMTCNYINLDNSSAESVQFQGINLLFPHDSPGFLQVCLNVFKFTVDITQKFYEANKGKTILLSAPTNLVPVSRGYLRLNSTDINDQPLIDPGYLSNKTDVVNLGKFLAHMSKLLETSYFKKVGAEFVDLGLCTKYKKFSVKYWECYAVAMSSTMWHYCGTAALGTVVDAKALVKGVTGLRVVDASIIPVVPTGKLNAAVLAVAEKIADVIRSTYKYFCCETKCNNDVMSNKNVKYCNCKNN